LLMVSCRDSAGQKFETCPTIRHQELFLNRENDRQHVHADMGQRIVICLQTIGGGQYDTAQISSKAVRLDRVEFLKNQNPGGPTQVYYFTATAEGEAQIRIPHTNSTPLLHF
jgi:hypothetical protein